MIVYVVTHQQIETAFNDWIRDATTDREASGRRFMYRVFKTFMASPEARLFHTITGLISFALDQWIARFEIWVSLEIKKQPGSEANIRKWSHRLIAHLSSNWCLDQKLIVKECLDQQDFNQKATVDEAVS